MKKRFFILSLLLCLALTLIPLAALAAPLDLNMENVQYLGGADQVENAVLIADALKEAHGIQKFDTIVLADAHSYVNSIAAPYLASVKNAPVLLYSQDKEQASLSYIQENLSPGGTVYLMGGMNIFPPSIEYALSDSGYQCLRLWGRNPYDGNMLTLEAAGFDSGTMLVCPGTNIFPGAIAGATGLPVLAVGKNATISAEIRNNNELVVMGNESFFDEYGEDIIADFDLTERLTGNSTGELSFLTAERFFESPDEVVVVQNNWADGLCAALLAYARNAPLFMVESLEDEYLTKYLEENNIQHITIIGASHVHTWNDGEYTRWPQCTSENEKIYKCRECGETKTEMVPPMGHAYDGGVCINCGEPTPTEPVEDTPRVAGGNRFETANLVGDQMKKNLGIEKFDAVVVASGTEFADALAGSYLAAVKNAPILLAYTTDKINDGVKDYIRANLKEGGTVYILGGPNAVPTSFEANLEGFEIKRLAGAHRFETNLMVLKEAGIGDKPILVATGLTFADSLSASAAKLPILLVYGDKLLPEQEAFLTETGERPLYILGGEGAVNTKMETVLTAYGTVERVAGNNRFETSVKIAEKFFDSPESAVLAYAWDFPDGLCGGPLAATMDAPLILTMAKYETQAANYLQTNGIGDGSIILGGNALIPDSSVAILFG